MTMMTMKTWMTRALQGAATTVLAGGLQAAWAAADLAGGPAKNQLDLHPPVTRIATEVQSLHYFMLIICLVIFIAVFGVAMLNGIVLVSFLNELRGKGLTIRDAVVQGTALRLRPVLMTASVAILGLLPMLLSQGVGAETQRPLAAVVVGGLITSTLLTLVLLPVLYEWIEERAERRTLADSA